MFVYLLYQAFDSILNIQQRNNVIFPRTVHVILFQHIPRYTL